jgi:hypothetical protein
VYVVEANTDGQLHRLLRMDLGGLADHAVSLRRGDGLPLTAEFVMREVESAERAARTPVAQEAGR